MRSESFSGRARRTARRLATIPYPAPAAPSLALCARLTLSMPLSPSSLPLSALASAGRSNSRSNPPSLPPPSAPVLWPSPAPRVRVPPRPPSLPFPGPWVFVPLSPCPRPRCTLPATHLSLSLFSLPPPGALASRLVARWSLRTPLRPSSLYARHASPSLPCPVSPLPLAGHCVGKSHARTWPSLYVSTRRSALSSAPAYCGRLARLWGTFVLLPHARSFMPPWHALFPALPSLPLCPPASASTLRSNSRGSAPSLPPLSVLAPWPCPAPCLLALPRPHVPPFPGPLVPGPRCLCPRLPFTLLAYISRSNTRGTTPTPPSPCRSLAPWFCLHRSPRPSTPALPPPPSPALAPLYTYFLSLRWSLCRQVARMSQARIRPLPSCPALSPLFSTQNTSQDTV